LATTYVEGLVNDPNGDEVVDVTALDNGDGYAEADTYATALIVGDYGQYGNHDILTDYEYLYQVLGSSQAFAIYYAPSCSFPTGETQEEASPNWSGTYHLAAPYVTGGEFSYAGWEFSETDGGGGDDGCWDALNPAQQAAAANVGYYSFNLVPTTYSFIYDGTYTDYAGDPPYPNYYFDDNGYSSDMVNLLYRPFHIAPCGNSQYQVMTMYCPYSGGSAQIWTVNHLVYTIGTSTLSVVRGSSPTWTESY
jgi:hypothetical protein